MENEKKIREITQEQIAQAMKDNPDLPYEFVKDVLVAREEIRAGLGEPYIFGGGIEVEDDTRS